MSTTGWFDLVIKSINVLMYFNQEKVTVTLERILNCQIQINDFMVKNLK